MDNSPPEAAPQYVEVTFMLYGPVHPAVYAPDDPPRLDSEIMRHESPRVRRLHLNHTFFRRFRLQRSFLPLA
jgi:hypothetical protein